MTVKEYVTDVIDRLDDNELQQVADYLAYLRFRARHRSAPLAAEVDFAALYGQFAEEDRALAEEGLADYQRGLAHEDAREVMINLEES